MFHPVALDSLPGPASSRLCSLSLPSLQSKTLSKHSIECTLSSQNQLTASTIPTAVLFSVSLSTMRFEDWDILLFSTGRDSKVPVKEFRVACKVVPDMEFSHSHGTYGLPIMTCFIPALAPGTPFNISIHRWRPPQVSHYTRTYSKHTELVKFEARILIDGLITA